MLTEADRVGAAAASAKRSDQLNPYHPVPLREFFELSEAKRTLKMLRIQYTLSHGSWLHLAEREFSVLRL